ncbi:MAG TPA: hypothetical protein VF614_15980 [Chthoniobacteraceae bacterium]|jgi:hypothetical protein
MKTARFSDLVKQCGHPEPYPLFIEPAKDRMLQSALAADRVLTIHQETVGTSSDFGMVGLTEERPSMVLVFPHSLKEFRDRRVIGIKYELLAESEEAAAEEPEQKPAIKRSKAKEEPRSTPSPERKLLEFPKQTSEPPSRPSAKPQQERRQAPPPSPPPQARSDERMPAIRKQLRQALKLLEQGKTVAAYQLIEKLDSSLEK